MAKTFGAESTADEVLEGVDLSGKRVLVTGVSAGLGRRDCPLDRRAWRHRRRHGARSGESAARARAKRAIRRWSWSKLDLASLASVRKAADELLKRGKPFDVIIANAGVMACPQGKTADGFETQFGTNHLGHFVFVNRLVPLLKSRRASRHAFVGGSSDQRCRYRGSEFRAHPYQPFTAYGRSKTANILYAVALDNRLKGRGVRATSIHPGGIQTELGRHMTPELVEQMMARISKAAKPSPAPAFRFKNVPQGSATSVWSGFVGAADAVGGHYCEDCHVCEVNDDTTSRVGVRSYALNLAHANDLWRKSEEMVGTSASRFVVDMSWVRQESPAAGENRHG